METVTQLASYRNGGFEVSVLSDGTKIRETLDAALPPVLPEQMDLKITDWCDAGCAWCHEKSTTKGTHADIDATLELLKALPKGAEIAIGGGDPLSHPEFERFVTALAAQGLVPSVTVNGLHFERHRAMLEKLTGEGKLYGVGFSYADSLPDWDYEHLVVHLIAGVHHPKVMDEAKRRYKVLLLGYKQHGRGKKLFQIRRKEVEDTLASWYRELFCVAKAHHLSFDNLAIEQLKPQRLFANPATFTEQYMGEEGKFSMYVDAVTQTFGLSSYSDDRYDWTTMQDMFATVRSGAGYPVATVQ
jgi:organic radical activating enzyme